MKNKIFRRVERVHTKHYHKLSPTRANFMLHLLISTVLLSKRDTRDFCLACTTVLRHVRSADVAFHPTRIEFARDGKINLIGSHLQCMDVCFTFHQNDVRHYYPMMQENNSGLVIEFYKQTHRPSYAIMLFVTHEFLFEYINNIEHPDLVDARLDLIM